MALAPKFAGYKLAGGAAAAASSPATKHTLELYLDYVCPFSAKMFNTFYTSVAPLISKSYPNLDVIFRSQIQPWHPSSTLVHESALAVSRLAPQKFWEYSAALMKAQKEYFDILVVNETRNQTYKRLAALAASVGVSEEQVYGLLAIPEKGEEGALNSGNGVTNDLKLLIKANRVIGVHVSPTVFFDGIEEKGISSSFSAEQWEDWLKKNVGEPKANI